MKTKSTKLWTDGIAKDLDVILKGALVLLSAEVAEKGAGRHPISTIFMYGLKSI